MEKANEFVQRVKKCYVGKDCIQVMLPHVDDSITILNSDGITYHTRANSKIYINQYMCDDRRKDFPYSAIPMHKEKQNGIIVTYVNQLFDWNKPYILIHDNYIFESYAVKDENEAILVTRYLEPRILEYKSLLSFDEVKELYENFGNKDDDCDNNHQKYLFGLDGGIPLTYDGEISPYFNFPFEYEYDHIELLSKILRKNGMRNILEIPTHDFIYDCFVTIDGGNIDTIKGIKVRYKKLHEYEVEILDFPVVQYTQEHVKSLKYKCEKISDPKISRRLNPSIPKEIIKAEKQKVRVMSKPF